MNIRVGCNIVYVCPQPTPMLLLLRPMFEQQIIEEKRHVNPEVPLRDYFDNYGNKIWRLVAPSGRLEIEYNAVIDMPATPDFVFPGLPKTPIEYLPDDVMMYTLPSRLCPSDLFVKDAWDLFGHVQGGWAQVQAVCDWIHTNIVYSPDSNSSTTAWDSYQQRLGVCRDFAHLGVSFCRALNFPARYVCGYLPDIQVPVDPTPMDFHAWFEVYIDGVWCTFDARHNTPRIGRIIIGRGRDAIDVAFSTIYGTIEKSHITVWAHEFPT